MRRSVHTAATIHTVSMATATRKALSPTLRFGTRAGPQTGMTQEDDNVCQRDNNRAVDVTKSTTRLPQFLPRLDTTSN